MYKKINVNICIVLHIVTNRLNFVKHLGIRLLDLPAVTADSFPDEVNHLFMKNTVYIERYNYLDKKRVLMTTIVKNINKHIKA